CSPRSRSCSPPTTWLLPGPSVSSPGGDQIGTKTPRFSPLLDPKEARSFGLPPGGSRALAKLVKSSQTEKRGVSSLLTLACVFVNLRTPAFQVFHERGGMENLEARWRDRRSPKFWMRGVGFPQFACNP